MGESHSVVTRLIDALKIKVSDLNYKNWFAKVAWDYQESTSTMTIAVESRFIRDWLSDHYLELIRFELLSLTDREHDVQFKIEKKIERTLDLFAENQNPVPQAIGNVTTPENREDQPQLSEARQRPSLPHQDTPQRSLNGAVTGFNPKYRLDNFIVGSANQLVFAACQAVAHQPGRSYNPLFIYGQVGLGKTHLLNAIGLEILKNNRHAKIIYTTGERFTNEVISAIRYNKMFEFRQKYRDQCDVLLIDDIQFIAGKDRTMEEFFHTFNALYEMRKQIVLTSDKMPREMLNLEDRLRSRFSWGLTVDVGTPDFETRMAILRRKADEEKVKIGDDILSFIAENITTNVRELEGAFIRLVAFASLTRMTLTVEVAKDVLKNILPQMDIRLDVEKIQHEVASFYRLKIADLKSKRRHKNLAVPRQIAMYLCKTHLQVSFPELGQRFGGKDHTTVMHAVQKIRGCLDTDATLKEDIQKISSLLGIVS